MKRQGYKFSDVSDISRASPVHDLGLPEAAQSTGSTAERPSVDTSRPQVGHPIAATQGGTGRIREALRRVSQGQQRTHFKGGIQFNDIHIQTIKYRRVCVYI